MTNDRIHNAHVLEMHELAMQTEDERFYLTPALLFATHPGESIPQDIVK